MKTITKALLLMAFAGILSQCKKGEDDPFLSLRSRKARVVGDWQMTEGKSTSSSSSTNYSSSYSSIYTETGYTETSTTTFSGVTTSNSYAGTHSLKLEFDKDGKYTLTETQDGDFYTTSGTWNFTGRIGDRKNKEQLVLTMTSEIGNGYAVTYSGNRTYMTFDIKELRNKKMVLVSNNSESSSNGSDSYTTELVLEQ